MSNQEQNIDTYRSASKEEDASRSSTPSIMQKGEQKDTKPDWLLKDTLRSIEKTMMKPSH